LQYAHLSPEIRQLLIKAGADVEKPVVYGQNFRSTLLLDATIKGYSEAVAFYLDQKLAPNDASSAKPLLAAVEIGNVQMVKLLLQHGADPLLTPFEDYPSSELGILHEYYHEIHLTGNFYNFSLKDFASRLADMADNPVVKARYTQLVRLIDHVKPNPDNNQ